MAKLWFSMLQRLFIPQKRKPRWNLELAVLSLWVARQVPSLSAFVTPKLLYL
jgi:dipeptidase